MQIVDTHVHVACADSVAFPRRPTGVGSAWWSEPDGEVAAVLGAAHAARVGHVVVVQAVGAYGYDCRCAAAAVASSGGDASLVAAIDMSVAAPAVPDGAEPAVGWRLFGVSDGAPWLDDERADAIWDHAAARRVVIVATVFSDRIRSLRAVIGRHPDVTVAIDHCAFPDMSAEGERPLRTLADHANVVLKVSSHVLAAWRDAGTLVESFDDLVAAFGAERLCWGSDHPQHQGLSYAEKLALAESAATNLDARQRALFFGGTAASIGWAGPSRS